MPKLPRSPYDRISPDDLLMTLQQMAKSLDSGISFGKTANNSNYQSPDHSDLNVWKANGTAPVTPNTEFSVSHNLTWVPWMFLYFTNTAGVIYKSTTAWTAATKSTEGNIYLKCSTASAVYTMVIF